MAAVLLLVAESAPAAEPDRRPAVRAVTTIGMTVGDADRSVRFYRDLLCFEVVSDRQLAGAEFERLTGVAAARARLVRLGLGDEELELTEYESPRGRPVPRDSRSNDLWFQHAAIVVRDMDGHAIHLVAPARKEQHDASVR